MKKLRKFGKNTCDGDGLEGLFVTVRRHEANGSHQLDGLLHHEGQVGLHGSGQERHGLLVLEHVLEADLVVHDGLQAFYALVLDFVPLAVTETRKSNEFEAIRHQGPNFLL